MKPDEQDSLWDVLGKARPVSVSPFFARNVLRKVRETKDRRIFSWLNLRWRATTLGTCAAVLLACAAGIHSIYLHDKRPNRPQQTAGAADYEVIAQLDELIAYEENSVWLDSSQD